MPKQSHLRIVSQVAHLFDLFSIGFDQTLFCLIRQISYVFIQLPQFSKRSSGFHIWDNSQAGGASAEGGANFCLICRSTNPCSAPSPRWVNSTIFSESCQAFFASIGLWNSKAGGAIPMLVFRVEHSSAPRSIRFDTFGGYVWGSTRTKDGSFGATIPVSGDTRCVGD